MAIAVKTYLTLSGLYKLSKIMFKDEDVYYIPKESWVFEKGKYTERIFVDKELTKNDKMWNGEPIDSVYSLETCMINLSWINKIKRMNIPVFDVPMIEWVEKKAFLSGAYNVFDKIICPNQYCYEIFCEKYNNVERYDGATAFESNIFEKKNVVYHQASCSTLNSFKNTDMAIDAFLKVKNPDYKMIITGLLNKNQERKIKSGNIEYKGIVTNDEVARIFKISKIYLSPSSQEGFSIPLYEAKASGCKIVTTNFSPMKELGDYLCDFKIGDEFSRFIYPKIILDFNSLVDNLDKSLKDAF